MFGFNGPLFAQLKLFLQIKMFGFFKKPAQESSLESYDVVSEGLRLHKLAKSLGNDELALVFYDQAIELIRDPHILVDRGYVLQFLKYDLEAIEDFNAAIASDPNDCNKFFGLGLSLGRVGKYKEERVAFDAAIKLGSIKSEFNDRYNEAAKSIGYSSHIALYSSMYNFNEGDFCEEKWNEAQKRVRKKFCAK